jgi:hypothetical protein
MHSRMQRKEWHRFNGSRWNGLRERCWERLYNSSFLKIQASKLACLFFFLADEQVILLVTNHIRTKSPALPDSRIVPGVVTPATVKL